MSRTAENTRVGFIGVGLMGHGMAKNMMAAGYSMTIKGHRNREPVDSLVSLGAVEARTPAEVAAQSDVVFLCLSTVEQIEEVMLGPDGIMSTAAEGLVVFDCSTSKPDVTLSLAKQCAGKKVRFIDAPLLRTPQNAEEGTLATLVGLSETDMVEFKKMFDCWAEVVVHCDQIGHAHRLKLINNLVALTYSSVYSEAYAACRMSGIEASKLHEVVGQGGMNCKNFQNFSKYVVEGDPNGHKFAIDNCVKDLAYYAEMASQIGVEQKVASGALETFKAAQSMGYGSGYQTIMPDAVQAASGSPASTDWLLRETK